MPNVQRRSPTSAEVQSIKRELDKCALFSRYHCVLREALSALLAHYLGSFVGGNKSAWVQSCTCTKILRIL